MSWSLGIIGHQIAYTLSPPLHALFLERCGLIGDYQVFDTELLPQTIEQLKARGVRGFNVTIPHKVAILPYLDRLTPTARLLGAVNTVRVEDDKTLTGDNTDMPGYLDGLPSLVHQTLHERPTLVLGAGGAARAVVAGLVSEHIPRLTIAARDVAKAKPLADLAADAADQARHRLPVNMAALSDVTTLDGFGLVVNTTPVGTGNLFAMPLPTDSLHGLPVGAFVSDLIYRPLETRLVSEAQAAGYEAEGGLPMLLHQAAHSFTFWTGRPLSEAVLKEGLDLLRSQLTDSVQAGLR